MAIPTPQRLRRGPDVRAVLAERCARHARVASVRVRVRGDDAPARVTVVAGKRVGPAVERNRAKRRLRAACQQLVWPRGVDAVVVARPAARDEPFSALRAQLERALVAVLADALAGADARRSATTHLPEKGVRT